MKTRKINRIMLAAAAVCAAVFALSAFFLAKSVRMNGSDSGLPMDVSEYDVTRMYADEGGYLVGTSNGHLLRYGTDGQRLWSVCPYGDTTVNDLRTDGGRVYAAFGNRRILSFSEKETPSDGLLTHPDTRVYNLQDVTPGEIAFGGGAYFAVRGADNEKGYLCFFPVAPEESDLAGDGSYRLFDHNLYKESRQFQSFCLLEDDVLYYTTANSNLNSLKVEGNRLSDEEILKFDQPLVGVVGTGKGISAVNGEGSLFVFEEAPKPGSHRYLRYSLGVGKEVVSADACGENFILSLKNGGVAGVDTARGRVSFSIGSSVYESVIMSAEDSFLLRYYKVGEPVSLSYYTYDYAVDMQTLGRLNPLFIVGIILFGIGLLFCGFSVRPPFGKRILKGFRSFFGALKTYRVVYLSLIPTFLLLAVFYYFPIVFGFTLSFTDYLPNDHMLFVGFENFGRVFQNEIFVKSIVSMLVFLGSDLLKAIIPPILFAEAIFAVRNKQFSFWTRALLFIPGILPGVAGSLVWAEGIFGANQNGLINAIGKIFVPSFMNINFFGSGTPLAIFSLIMFGFPWIGSYLIFYGAITGVPTSMYEAAKLDGCGWWRRIVSLDLPLILPQIKYIFITSFIASIQNYSTIYVVLGTGGPVYTPALLMYSEVMNSNYGMASAMSILLFLFLMVATFLNFRMQSDKT